jgi:hypothetical protein
VLSALQRRGSTNTQSEGEGDSVGEGVSEGQGQGEGQGQRQTAVECSDRTTLDSAQVDVGRAFNHQALLFGTLLYVYYPLRSTSKQLSCCCSSFLAVLFCSARQCCIYTHT